MPPHGETRPGHSSRTTGSRPSKHAVVCDLSVDPYLLDAEPRVVRGIEGTQGSLDQWEFAPDDPAWDRLPPDIPTSERRTVVSCYSWPGVRPEPCMHVYGSQLAPLLEVLVAAGSVGRIDQAGKFHERALWRGSPRGWFASGEAEAYGTILYLGSPAPSCNGKASRSVASLLKQRTRRTTR